MSKERSEQQERRNQCWNQIVLLIEDPNIDNLFQYLDKTFREEGEEFLADVLQINIGKEGVWSYPLVHYCLKFNIDDQDGLLKQISIVELLLNYGADPSSVDYKNRSLDDYYQEIRARVLSRSEPEPEDEDFLFGKEEQIEELESQIEHQSSGPQSVGSQTHPKQLRSPKSFTPLEVTARPQSVQNVTRRFTKLGNSLERKAKIDRQKTQEKLPEEKTPTIKVITGFAAGGSQEKQTTSSADDFKVGGFEKKSLASTSYKRRSFSHLGNKSMRLAGNTGISYEQTDLPENEELPPGNSTLTTGNPDGIVSSPIAIAKRVNGKPRLK